MKKLILILIAATLLSSCAKEKRQECDIYNYGTLKLSNITDDVYNFYIDNVFITAVNPGYYYYYEKVTSGTHSYKIEQGSGYILYPDVLTGNITLSDCQTQLLAVY